MVELPEEYKAYLLRRKVSRGTRSTLVQEVFDRTEKIASYRDDPTISEHDKELQWVMDYDMPSPEEMVRWQQTRLDILTGKIPYAEYESCGYWSYEEEVQDVEVSLSVEAIAEYREEYEAYLALREEAIAAGFGKHGNCRNVRSLDE